MFTQALVVAQVDPLAVIFPVLVACTGDVEVLVCP
jgi:hypothetical protein